MPDKTTKTMLLELLEKNFSTEQTFTLQEIYAVVEAHLQEARPNNNTIQHTVRGQLQSLKKDGVLTFVDGNGTYAWNSEKSTDEEPVRGTLYILRNTVGDLGGYKIGISRTIKERLRTLEVGKKAEVVGLWDSPNYTDLERILHKRYKQVRVSQSEWFALTDAELSDIADWLDANATQKECYITRKPKETVKEGMFYKLSLVAILIGILINAYYWFDLSNRIDTLELEASLTAPPTLVDY